MARDKAGPSRAEGNLTDKNDRLLAGATTTCLIFEQCRQNIDATSPSLRCDQHWRALATVSPRRAEADPNSAVDLEGQDHMVQETVASLVQFPTGSAAPWHMHPSAQEIGGKEGVRSRPVRRSTKISMHSRIVRRSTTSMVVTVLMLPRIRRAGGARRPVSRYTGPIARGLAYARPESHDAGKQQQHRKSCHSGD
jgi:hypothetical protein